MKSIYSPEFARNYGFWNEHEQKALMAARNYVTELNSIYTNQYSNYASFSFYKDKLKYAIFNYVVDCWIKIEDVTTKK